jgi:FtsZ-binding cell division protein ZapB
LNEGLDVLSKDKKTGSEQIIILLSDGMMDVGDPEENATLVEKIKNELTGTLKDKGVKVYAIAFTEQSDKKLLEKLSKQTGGFFNFAPTETDFHLIFTSIFESLKKPEMLPMSNNGFLIDQSIEEVTIVATKVSPDTRIQIDSPEGLSYSYKYKPPDIKWFVSNKFDMITVKNPGEGRWEILFSTGKNNKAYIITNLQLQTNFNQLYSTFGDPFDMEIWFEKDGSPIKDPDVLEKIDIHIELSRPDGGSLKLKPFNKVEGIFSRRIAPYTPGNYKLRIVADGKTFEREKLFVFNVASAKESQKEINAKRSAKEVEEQEEKAPVEDTATDEVSWGEVTIKFLPINLVLGIIFFVYLKREKLKDIKGRNNLIHLLKLTSFIKKGKQEAEEEQERYAEKNDSAQEETVKEVRDIEEHKEQTGSTVPAKEIEVNVEGKEEEQDNKDEQNEPVKEVQIKVDEMQEKEERQEKKNTDYEEKIGELTNDIKNQENKDSELAGIRNMFNDLHEKFEHIKKINAKIKKTIASLTLEAEKSKEYEQLIAEIEKSNKEFDICIVTLEKENEELNQNINSFKDEVKGLSGKLKESVSKADFDMAVAEKNRFEIKVKKLEEQLDEKTEEYEKLEGEQAAN